ncbi:MAG: FkbM family methyltransferase [Bacteroidia bacterium]
MGPLIQLSLNSSLTENGWFQSFKKKESVDKNGNPIAWCTYPFLSFIEPRLKDYFQVFEYGCGNSTIWYANKVKSIKSVEHDDVWLNKIKHNMPANSDIVYKSLEYGGEYSKEVGSSGAKYHIVIIDGRDRNNSMLNALQHLTPDGVIVFDNAHLKTYQSSINEALSRGFRRIDFYGMAPIIPSTSCTSIIYRDENCLGI